MKRYTKGFYGSDAIHISEKINEYIEKEKVSIIQTQFIKSPMGYECLVIFEKE